MLFRFLIIFFLYINQAYSQQNQYHFIIKNKDNQRLPYASISWFKSAGFSANEMGVLSISSNTPIDSIVVANIGYRTLYTPIKYLEKINDSFLVTLSSQESELPPITIFSGKKNAEFGVDERHTSFISNGYKGLIGVVRVIQPGKVCKIESLSVFIDRKSDQGIPFRIRIFSDTEKGFPGDDLLRESIVIDTYKIGDWNSFNLNDRNILIEHPSFYIGIEWLNLPNKIGNGTLQIGLTNKIKDARSYFRFANRDWKIHSVQTHSSIDNLLIKTKILL